MIPDVFILIIHKVIIIFGDDVIFIGVSLLRISKTKISRELCLIVYKAVVHKHVTRKSTIKFLIIMISFINKMNNNKFYNKKLFLENRWQN